MVLPITQRCSAKLRCFDDWWSDFDCDFNARVSAIEGPRVLAIDTK